MRETNPTAEPRYCHCGAIREAAKFICRKCHYRNRWYRRKAWRVNLNKSTSGKK